MVHKTLHKKLKDWVTPILLKDWVTPILLKDWVTPIPLKAMISSGVHDG
jgi:hypothetical protein